MLEVALAGAIGAEIDHVCLVGSDVAPEPRGIFGARGVNTITLGTAASSYDFLSHAVQAVREDHREPTAHPRTFGELNRLKDTTHQPLAPPK